MTGRVETLTLPLGTDQRQQQNGPMVRKQVGTYSVASLYLIMGKAVVPSQITACLAELSGAIEAFAPIFWLVSGVWSRLSGKWGVLSNKYSEGNDRAVQHRCRHNCISSVV